MTTRNCFFCGKPETEDNALKKCSVCIQSQLEPARYCNVDCQKKDWKGHKKWHKNTGTIKDMKKIGDQLKKTAELKRGVDKRRFNKMENQEDANDFMNDYLKQAATNPQAAKELANAVGRSAKYCKHYGRGWKYYDQNDFLNAAKQLRKAIKEEQSGEAARLLAKAYMCSGQTELFITTLLQAMEYAKANTIKYGRPLVGDHCWSESFTLLFPTLMNGSGTPNTLKVPRQLLPLWWNDDDTLLEMSKNACICSSQAQVESNLADALRNRGHALSGLAYFRRFDLACPLVDNPVYSNWLQINRSREMLIEAADAYTKSAELIYKYHNKDAFSRDRELDRAKTCLVWAKKDIVWAKKKISSDFKYLEGTVFKK